MTTTVTSAADSLDEARRMPYWLDDPARPEALEPLTADTRADLVVVGGGYTGLWTALRAKERDPGRDVVLLEATRCGSAASGRNGGFAEPSLTHGFANGMARWPDEMSTLLRMGTDNLEGLADTVAGHRIDCGLERSGELAVATREHEVCALAEETGRMQAAGLPVRLLDSAAVRARVDSPTYLAALHDPQVVMVEPARLAWGLRATVSGWGSASMRARPSLGSHARGAVSRCVPVRRSSGAVAPCSAPTPRARCCDGCG